ncbi:MAG: histidine kinase [Rhodobacteraceae bacterium CG17_big_fil_post_rev_8_21_14_2_50_65_11]|nr:MAG: histidine kinase [Rhodobacteraceae bacterium CG17_big_fil_post_rev_8_21_14_2_50_65_11]
MIDRERLQDLRDEIGEEDFAEVVTMFLDEMGSVLQDLRDNPEMAGADSMHGLRGSALNLGFTDFADACTTAERQVGAGRPVDVVYLDWLFRESVASFGADLPATAA